MNEFENVKMDKHTYRTKIEIKKNITELKKRKKDSIAKLENI